MSEFLLQIGRLGGCGSCFFSQIFSGPGILQSSRFFRPLLTVYSGFEPATSRSAVRYATNSANHSQSPAPLTTECPGFCGFWSQSGFHYAKPSGNVGLNINGTLCEGGNVRGKVGHLWLVGPVRLKVPFIFQTFLRPVLHDWSRTWINIKVSVKTFSNGTPRLGWKFCFYPALCFYFLLNYFQWSLTCLSSLRQRGHSDSVLVKYTQYLQYIINRGYYMAARTYEISLRVLKNISRVSSANEWNIFSLREEKFRICKRPCNVLFII